MRTLVVGAVLFGALAAVTPAYAQVPEPVYDLSVDGEGTVITPITGMEKMGYILTVTCAPGTPGPGPEPIPVDMEVRAADERAVVVMASLRHIVELPPQECLAGTTQEYFGDLSVTFGQDAPAGAHVPITLSATNGETTLATATWNVTAGVYHAASAQFKQAIWQAPQGSTIDMPFVLENEGNGATTFHFELGQQTSSALEIVLPEPKGVAAGETATVGINVTTPSGALYENRRDQFYIVTRAISDVDGSDGDPIERTAVIQTQGTAAGEIPGVPILTVLGLLGLLAARRSAQDVQQYHHRTGPRFKEVTTTLHKRPVCRGRT